MLHEIGDGTWAYVQRDGGWGWSNAGLVVDPGAGRQADAPSLLVDTLFDLQLTAAMLDAMRAATPAAAAIDVVVNTHANGDHCYGNQLVAGPGSGADVIASTAGAAEMDEVPPAMLASFAAAAPDLGEAGTFLADIFGSFTFDGIEPASATTTFDGELRLTVGDRAVHLLELGPAHTRGDVVVHLPDDGVVFTGDLVFHGGHPIVWAGPIANWIAACDRLLALDATTVVPGHGPISDRTCIEDQRGYFEWLVAEGTPRLTGGMAPMDAAKDLSATHPYAAWGERERLVVNLTILARDLGLAPATDVLTMFSSMAELRVYVRSTTSSPSGR